jgi:HK97 family phage prohead protease
MFLDGDFVIDADQENINTFGIDLKRLRNGILPLLFNHQQDKAVGTVMSATYDKDGLLITAKLFKLPNDALTNYTYEAVKAGIIKAFSVGIIVKDFEVIDQDQTEYLQLAKSELIEVSLVPVPANHEALFRTTAIKSADGQTTVKTLLDRESLKEENPSACNGFECAIKSAQIEQKEVDMEVKNTEPVTPVEEVPVAEDKEAVMGVTPEAYEKLDEITNPEEPLPVESETATEGETVVPEDPNQESVDKANDVPSENPKEEYVEEVDPVKSSLDTLNSLNVQNIAIDDLEQVYEVLSALVEQIESRVVTEVAEAMKDELTVTAPAE